MGFFVDNSMSKCYKEAQMLREYIERNSIALLSNIKKYPVDQHSDSWLGKHSTRKRVRESGLWNHDHTTDSYDPEFLTIMSRLNKQHGAGDDRSNGLFC